MQLAPTALLLLVFATAGCERLSPQLPAARVDPGTNIPPPPKGEWLVDRTNTLSADTHREVNAIAKSVEDAGTGQMAVVVVDEVLGEKPRPYAMALFNRWGIGTKERNDGVLLFVSLGNRTVDILLGYGVEGPKEEAESGRLIREELVPRFTRGENDGAIVAGARGLARLLADAHRSRGKPRQGCDHPVAGYLDRLRGRLREGTLDV